MQLKIDRLQERLNMISIVTFTCTPHSGSDPSNHTFLRVSTPSLVLGSVWMPKIWSSFPETISNSASQLSVFSRSESRAWNLMTSTSTVFSLMLPEYCRDPAEVQMRPLITDVAQKGRARLNSAAMLLECPWHRKHHVKWVQMHS